MAAHTRPLAMRAATTGERSSRRMLARIMASGCASPLDRPRRRAQHWRQGGDTMNMRAWAALVLLSAVPAAATAAPEQQMQAGAQSFRAGNFQHALEQWTLAAAAYEAAANREGQ